ncbi:MAG: protein-L-isoaspartate(D-aspartate) O-methyltransferase [Magnetococcales bacterium]|nr:protein-L-isoaspartate(D-aspartate) O-methyltransferase [Magnetococcales bacterium]
MLDPAESRPWRQQMIERQLLARGVSNRAVLQAMQEIPRELFAVNLPLELVYRDGPLPIGQGQTISQPFMVAVMAALLALPAEGKVLEIGAGSGYGAAVLSRLARQVVAVERLPELLLQAEKRWQQLGLHTIHPVLADGSIGCPEQAPFDGIVVTAAAPAIPPSLLQQLRPDSGRLVVPVGGRAEQILQVVSRDAAGRITVSDQFACRFVPLLGREGWPC